MSWYWRFWLRLLLIVSIIFKTFPKKYLRKVNNYSYQFRTRLININWAASSEFGWLCWGLTSQSTIFQSYRDGAIASWVINQYFRGVKCLAQGHNTAAVGLEPGTSRSGVRHSTTEPPCSPQVNLVLIAYASSEGSGKPAHPRSLARTFAARSYKQWVKRNLQTESQIPGHSEWLGMRN